MTDLSCENCHWIEPGFDNGTEIDEYMAETDLLQTHFADQDCPKCGAEKSLKIYYRICRDCKKAEPDCTCDIESPDMSQKEAENLQKEIFSILRDKIEKKNMQAKREKMDFKRRDLRLIAEELLQKHYGDREISWGKEDEVSEQG